MLGYQQMPLSNLDLKPVAKQKVVLEKHQEISGVFSSVTFKQHVSSLAPIVLLHLDASSLLGKLSSKCFE